MTLCSVTADPSRIAVPVRPFHADTQPSTLAHGSAAHVTRRAAANQPAGHAVSSSMIPPTFGVIAARRPVIALLAAGAAIFGVSIAAAQASTEPPQTTQPGDAVVAVIEDSRAALTLTLPAGWELS